MAVVLGGTLTVQSFVHEPQFVMVVMLVSQPSVCLLLLQSAKPDAQVPLQTLAAHVGVGMFWLLHALLHSPQCSGSVDVLVSQPDAVVQSNQPDAQG